MRHALTACQLLALLASAALPADGLNAPHALRSRCTIANCERHAPFSASSNMLCEVFGVSVSKSGLVVLLSAESRYMALPVTDDADRNRASSTRALTILQLLQGIDLAPVDVLPPEKLFASFEAAGLTDYGCISALGEVTVLDTHRFLLRAAHVPTGEGSQLECICTDPFVALALALRYKARVSVAAEVFEREAFDRSALSVSYPSPFTKGDALEQQASILQRLAGASSGQASTPKSRANTAAPEILDVMGSTIEVAHATAAVAMPPGLGQLRTIDGPSPELLQRALEIARRRGDASAMEKIERALRHLDIQDALLDSTEG